MTSLTQAFDDLKGEVGVLRERFASMDRLAANAWKALGAVILSIVMAASSVLVQNWFLHQQTQTATLQAAAKLASNPPSMQEANAKADQILQKLDDLKATSKHK